MVVSTKQAVGGICIGIVKGIVSRETMAPLPLYACHLHARLICVDAGRRAI